VFRSDEEVARHAFERVQHARIVDTARSNLLRNHASALARILVAHVSIIEKNPARAKGRKISG
jgi:hypothetical protein